MSFKREEYFFELYDIPLEGDFKDLVTFLTEFDAEIGVSYENGSLTISMPSEKLYE